MNPSPHAASSRTSNFPEYQARAQDPLHTINVAQKNLIYAIKNEGEENFDVILDSALSAGASLNTVDEDGLSPLEIAVKEKKPRIAQSLLSRGSSLPFVHSNGFDLVMLAASQGETAMLLVLLDKGEMLPDAQDACGATALHYAVIGGHLQSAIVLLDREADIDIYMKGDIDPNLRKELNMPDNIGEVGTTALMLAVSLRDCVLTDFLLTRGASPFCGARHPIEIAILNNDVSMLDLLLKKNIDPNEILLRDGRSLLTLSIENNCSPALIKKLLPAHLQTKNGLDAPSRLLHHSIHIELDDVVAQQDRTSEKNESGDVSSTSSRALGYHPNSQIKISGNHATPQADQATKIFSTNGMSLSYFCQFASQPAAFSACGIFPEALASALPTLQILQDQSHNLSLAQIDFEVAYYLHNLKKIGPNVDATALFSVQTIMNVADEPTLANGVTRKINAQIDELRKIGGKLLVEKVNKFSYFLSRIFFELMLEKCPHNTDLSDFIQNKLTEEDGLPLAIAKFISTAWVTSYDKSKRTPYVHTHDNLLLQRTESDMIFSLENTLLKKIIQYETMANRRSFCLNALFNTLTKRHSPIKQFVTDPVAFLRLLPPFPAEKNLSKEQFVAMLCASLGLPVDIAKKIYEAWALACEEASIAIPSKRAGQVYDFLSRAMAASLKLMLHGPRNHRQDGEFTMPIRLQSQLLEWCNTILAQQTEDDAETDLNDQQRPHKRARLEYQ